MDNKKHFKSNNMLHNEKNKWLVSGLYCHTENSTIRSRKNKRYQYLYDYVFRKCMQLQGYAIKWNLLYKQ